MKTDTAKIARIKKEALAQVKPSAEEESKLRKFLRDLLTVAKVRSVKDVVICGSIGKGDWHSGNHDIDLFILFPKKTKREQLEDDGLLYGKQIAKEMHGTAVMKFAEHPYIKATIEGYDIDIVPAYKIKPGEKIISAVDRSPLHLQYIMKHFDEKLRDETRLLKQFMRAISVYGSDVKTEGFSGYSCELLVLKYGSFENVLKAAAKWHAQQVVVLKGKTGKNILKQFQDQPLIIIDPVDKDRNVTTIVSPENFIYFIKKANDFLKEPSISYFTEQPLQPLTEQQTYSLQERKTKFFALEIDRPKDALDDTLYPQLRRTMRRLNSLLKENEFIVIRNYLSEEFAGRIYMVYELEVWELPAIKKMTGPFIESKKNVNDFLSKYSPGKGFVPYVEGRIWFVDRKRDCREAAMCIRSFIGQEITELEKQGIPRNVVDIMFKARILEHEKFWNLIKENESLSSFLRKKYFESMI